MLYPEMHATLMACMVPVMAGMLGTLLLGTLIGWYYSPGPLGGTAPVRTEMGTLRITVNEQQRKLALLGSIAEQRVQQLEADATRERTVLEERVAALQEENATLRAAAMATKRTTTLERHLDGSTGPNADNKLTERIAQLEKSVARMPALLKELDELREALRLGPAPEEAAPARLPEQVYRVMSDAFGKRIEQDDLRLVEGIGPKIQEHLRKNGLRTWADIASTKPEQLKEVLAQAGDHFRLHDPSHWPEQARLMVENRWEELRKYQRKLSHAR